MRVSTPSLRDNSGHVQECDMPHRVCVSFCCFSKWLEIPGASKTVVIGVTAMEENYFRASSQSQRRIIHCATSKHVSMSPVTPLRGATWLSVALHCLSRLLLIKAGDSGVVCSRNSPGGEGTRMCRPALRCLLVSLPLFSHLKVLIPPNKRCLFWIRNRTGVGRGRFICYRNDKTQSPQIVTKRTSCSMDSPQFQLFLS